MSTVPWLVERYKNFVRFSIRNTPDVGAYRFSLAATLDAAYAGATNVFTVASGSSFRSQTLRRKRLGMLDESSRGLTPIFYDPDDFAGVTVPPDGHVAFLRVEERNQAGVFRPQGPILIIPPAPAFSASRSNLTVAGTAPAVAGLPTLVAPDDAMHFILPRYADAVNIRNDGGSDLYVSFGEGQVEIVVPSLSERVMPDAVVSEVYVRGDGGATAFSMGFAIVNGTYE